jgi:hypothetical protein
MAASIYISSRLHISARFFTRLSASLYLSCRFSTSFFLAVTCNPADSDWYSS